jgi:glutathione synthase/RimK-type ligase-like ATP-grasp enzyme
VRKIKIHQLSDGIINHNSWYIVQEMIDSSKWIPWIISSIHDIRFFILGNTLWKSVLLRTPPENDFRCNISQWWSSENIDFSKLPIDMQLFAKNIHKKIHNKFWIIFWSIDIVMANNRYYLIEFNSSPWVNLHAIGSPKLKEYHKTISLFFNNI